MTVMTKNILTNLENHQNTGVMPAVKPIDDFFVRDVAVNSWFAVGHFEKDGEKLNYLYHLMIMKQKGMAVINANLSMTNETTGWYHSDDQVYPLELAEIKEIGEGKDKQLSITVPNGKLVGNLEKMHWEAEMEHGSFSIDLVGKGLPIYNAGTGQFPTVTGEPFNQYSVPNYETSGELIMDGKVYQVDGLTWFDRQWQEHGNNFDNTKWTWSWMNLILDNGDKLSLWDMHNVTLEENSAWATVIHPDGSQNTYMVERLVDSARDEWASPVTGQHYPTKWTVTIPDIQASLTVTSVVKESEIVSQIPFLNKYEGASTISGTYKGQEVTGYCYTELLGDFSKD